MFVHCHLPLVRLVTTEEAAPEAELFQILVAVALNSLSVPLPPRQTRRVWMGSVIPVDHDVLPRRTVAVVASGKTFTSAIASSGFMSVSESRALMPPVGAG